VSNEESVFIDATASIGFARVARVGDSKSMRARDNRSDNITLGAYSYTDSDM